MLCLLDWGADRAAGSSEDFCGDELADEDAEDDDDDHDSVEHRLGYLVMPCIVRESGSRNSKEKIRKNKLSLGSSLPFGDGQQVTCRIALVRRALASAPGWPSWSGGSII